MDNIPRKIDGDKVVIDARPLTNKKRIGTSTVLSSVAATLLVLIALIYLAEINPDFQISWKSLTINGVLIFVFSQCFHGILKAIAREKKRNGEEYAAAQKAAKEAIERLGKSEYSARVNEYCARHTEETIERIKSSILAPAGISYEEYKRKYIGKDRKELAEAFPGEHLTRNQVRAICRCNRVKVDAYDPNFLRECYLNPNENVEPSKRYRPHHDDKVETIRNAVSGFVLCLFVVNIGGEIILNWSVFAVITCLVKLVVTIISGITGYSFGSKNADTEIALMQTKASESDACIEWCKRNPVPAQIFEKSEQLAGNSDRLPNVTFTLFKGTGE